MFLEICCCTDSGQLEFLGETERLQVRNGAEGIRTPDLPDAIGALPRLSVQSKGLSHIFVTFPRFNLALSLSGFGQSLKRFAIYQLPGTIRLGGVAFSPIMLNYSAR